MDYDLYHAESREANCWHGILLVPRATRQRLLGYLGDIRSEKDYHFPVTFEGLEGGADRIECARMWLELGIDALIQNMKGPVRVFSKNRAYSEQEDRPATEYKELIRFVTPIKARFVLFKASSHTDEDEAQTIFSTGLKGGLNYLFDELNPANVRSMHFDGNRHYDLHHAGEDVREYCSFDGGLEVDLRGSDHHEDDSQHYDDCQMLQLAGLLVGAFRTMMGDEKDEILRAIAYPCTRLIERWNNGYALQEGRWYKGFCLSECRLENGEWDLSDMVMDMSSEFLF